MTDDPSTIFRPLDTFENATLLRSGYTPRWLSVFDHWLSEDEAGASPLMSFGLATKHGADAVYLGQERQFLAFYDALLGTGTLRRLPTDMVETHAAFDGALTEAVTRSLREQELMDVFVPALKLRLVGGYDRTDLLLFEEPAHIKRVAALASEHGLFLLA